MEDEQDCGYDFIEVFSGYDDTGPSYGRFCGNKVLYRLFIALSGFVKIHKNSVLSVSSLCHCFVFNY